MKVAGLYKDKKGYIFCSMSTSVAGFWISTEPEIRLYFDSAPYRIVHALKEVVNASSTNVPTPVFNQDLKRVQKALKKEKEKRLDIKSFADLDKSPVLFCSVRLENDTLIFSPQMHDLEKGGIGYTSIGNVHEVLVPYNAPDEIILTAIVKSFAKCK